MVFSDQNNGMNVKSVANNLMPFEIKNLKANRKAEASSERDANARQEGQQGQTPRRNLSEEELQAALNHLKNIKGIKDNNLTVRLERLNGIVNVYVEDMTGKVIRRIPEAELSQLTQSDKAKGNILDKSM